MVGLLARRPEKLTARFLCRGFAAAGPASRASEDDGAADDTEDPKCSNWQTAPSHCHHSRNLWGQLIRLRHLHMEVAVVVGCLSFIAEARWEDSVWVPLLFCLHHCIRHVSEGVFSVVVQRQRCFEGGVRIFVHPKAIIKVWVEP